MRKIIIQKILLFLLLTSPITSAVIIFGDTLFKEIYCSLDIIDTELGEDDGISDSNEVSISDSLNGQINHQERFNFSFLRNHLPKRSDFFNLQEIYLGLSTPPPKSFFS